MDFADQIQALSQKIPDVLDFVKTEASTRSSLVEPFIRALGYDTSNPREVVPEFWANVDIPEAVKDQRVDYAILHDGMPIILIECKHHSSKLEKGFNQLFSYYAPTSARMAILTNGVRYRLYADLDKSNIMDKTPFLEFDMTDVPVEVVQELKRLSKSSFNIEEAIAAARQLKYVRGFKAILRRQLEEPEDKFIQFFFSQLCPGSHFAGGAKEVFRGYAKRSFNELVEELLREKFNEFISPRGAQAPEPDEPEVEPESLEPDEAVKSVTTTEEEIQGFYIIKAILCDVIAAERIRMKDYQAYCNILLDGRQKYPLCRFYFNNPKNLRIGLFDKGGKHAAEEKIPIDSVEDIYLYYDRIKATLPFYIDTPVAL